MIRSIKIVHVKIFSKLFIQVYTSFLKVYAGIPNLWKTICMHQIKSKKVVEK